VQHAQAGLGRYAAVLGSPIAHSLSPVLHMAAYEHLGLAGWSYRAIECAEQDLPQLIDQVRGDPAFAGYSLTMPLKLAVLALLDELEPRARQVGAVNTVVPREGGLFGANTDVPGLVNALREAGINTVANPIVLGGGGSAQAAIASLAVLGATKVQVVLRNRRRVAGLAEVADRSGVELVARDWSPAGLPEADLVISAVPAAAWEALVPWAQHWPRATSLFDLVYAPWPTVLADAAMRGGALVLGGLELLVHQAVGQIELMTGRTVDVSVLRAAGERALAER
jgi:shikimate dehydrogenase